LLSAARPNPFTRSASLRYAIPRPGRIRVTIHDLQGRAIAALIDGWVAGGSGAIEWNGCDAASHDVGAGVFFARVEWNGQIRTQRLVRIP